MLRSLKRLCGKRLIAQDAVMGNVQDFFFDDQKWVIRYVVAHTGAWLSERLVLIAPQAFEPLFQRDEGLLVNLSRQQIQDSPEITSDQLVSRRYEEDCCRYYGWPFYWHGNERQGLGGYPVIRSLSGKLTGSTHSRHSSKKARESNLRSAKSLRNYLVQSEGRAIGRVIDLIMEEESWEIRQLIVDTNPSYSEEEIAISPDQIDDMSEEQSKIFVTMNGDALGFDTLAADLNGRDELDFKSPRHRKSRQEAPLSRKQGARTRKADLQIITKNNP